MRVTERTFGHLRGGRMHRLLERADVPLRTVELLYVALGSGSLSGSSSRSRARPRCVRSARWSSAARCRSSSSGSRRGAGSTRSRTSSRPAGHARRVAEGGPQLPPGDPGGRRRGPAAREQGVQARANRDAARPADGRRARRHGRAGRLEEPLLRRHRGDDPAPGRRQPRRHLRHGRRGRTATGSSSPARSAR